jgi:hypothetical protein
MGKMKELALDYNEQVEQEWYEEQYALLRSQGYEHEEVEEMLAEQLNEHYQEIARDNADIMVEPYHE